METQEELQQMNVEWGAWGTIVVRLQELGVRINDAHTLHNALRRWGEEMGKLRHLQALAGKPTEAWLEEARNASPLSVVDDAGSGWRTVDA